MLTFPYKMGLQTARQTSLLCGLVLACVGALSGDTGAEETLSARQYMDKGATSYKQGAFGQAALHWNEAARLYEQDGKAEEQGKALIRLAQALQQMGQYRKAAVTLHVALGLAERTDNRTQMAIVLGSLGNTSLLLGEAPRAGELLDKALAIAREQQKPAFVAVFLNDRGNVLASQDRNSEAIGAYTDAATLANATGQQALAATAQINRAMASLQDGLYADAKDQLDLASRQVQALEDSHQKAYGLLNIGLAYDDLRAQLPRSGQTLAQGKKDTARGSRGLEIVPSEPKKSPTPGKGPRPLSASDESLRRRAAESFQAAAKVAANLKDARAESYAWGYLGHLSEKQRRFDEALDLTRKAVFAAQKANAPETLYRWHWQTARVLKAQGKEDEALQAYRRAAFILQPIRHEFWVGYHARRHSFRESVGPLFFELADLLLTRAARTSDPKQYEMLLVQARDTTEAFKAAELQDYFRDECVKAARSHRKTVDVVSGATAVVYPILLPDRLELLVSLPSGLKRFAVPVTADALTQVVRAFRTGLQDRRTQDYLPHAKQLYAWLIRPLELDLRTLNISTLVFVPDGALRTIPMASLHDGKQFLIQKYALAVTPGMELTDPRPINRAEIKMLSLGLTESVQGFPALPYVAAELNAVKSLYGGQLFLNEQFLVPRMEQEMKNQQYTIVHIASHGLVESDVQKSFILAYDEKITMDRLAELIGMYQFRQSPLELLTLSACETAAGDDRAALGLAGVAIKAGARSALATLWFIDDEATSQLVEEFYRQLRDPTVSKAVALQRAQVKILSDPSRQHPNFWAPFLLINNWL